jgi:hypothetical protein
MMDAVADEAITPSRRADLSRLHEDDAPGRTATAQRVHKGVRSVRYRPGSADARDESHWRRSANAENVSCGSGVRPLTLRADVPLAVEAPISPGCSTTELRLVWHVGVGAEICPEDPSRRHLPAVI